MHDSMNVTALLAVLAGVAYAIYRLRRHLREKAATRNAIAIAALANAQRFEVRSRLGITVIGLLLIGVIAIALGAGAYIMARTNALALASVLALLDMALLGFTVVSLPRMLRNDPTLTLDMRGLHFARLGRVAWPEIVAIDWWVRKVKNGEINSLRILMRKPARYLDSASWMLRLTKHRWRTQSPRYGYLDIPMDYVDQAPAVIHAAALQFRDRVSPPRVTLWHAGMDDRQIDGLVALAEQQDEIDAGLHSTDPERVQAANARLPAFEREVDEAHAQAAAQAKRGQWMRWGWNALVAALVIVVMVLKVKNGRH